MADPVTAAPEEARAWLELPPRTRALGLLRRPDFRRAYLAVVTLTIPLVGLVCAAFAARTAARP